MINEFDIKIMNYGGIDSMCSVTNGHKINEWLKKLLIKLNKIRPLGIRKQRSKISKNP